MGLEFELKYRATPEKIAAIRNAVSSAEQHFLMQTTYYDTPSGELSKRHWTLRCRQENQTSVCTLKLPAPEGRAEFELECQRIEDALVELCKLSGQTELLLLARQGLVPVCGARFQRIAKTLSLASCTVELALDTGILLGGDRELPLCEIEVELKAGTPEAACAYGEALAQTYGLQPETASKFRRALALAKGE